MDRLKVGILFGGCSEEHPISVKSAQEVAQHLDVEKYEPFYIGITKRGAWKLCDGGPDAHWENGGVRPPRGAPGKKRGRVPVLGRGGWTQDRVGGGCPSAARERAPAGWG